MIRSSQTRKRNAPLVVKVGGSLQSHLPELVPELAATGRPLLIVPGGGLFADAVRESGAGDDSAHWMAVAAMDQYGWLIASQGMPATSRLEIPRCPSVFLPYCAVRRYDPLPHSWDVTSDSIAAWVADRLGLDLILLKSVDGIIHDGILVETVTTPLYTGTVDPFFIPFILEKEIATIVINGTRPGRIKKTLRGDRVPGTRIGTTF